MRDHDVSPLTGAAATLGAAADPRPLGKAPRRAPPSMRQVGRRATPAPSDAFRVLFRQSPLPVWVFDRETRRVLDVNEAALRAYGYSRQEFLSLRDDDLRPPAEGDAAGHAPRRHRTRGGHLFDVLTTAQPLEFAGRAAVAVFASAPVAPEAAPAAGGAPRDTGLARPAPRRAAGGCAGPQSSSAVAARLRERLLGDLYSARCCVGDRLPSIREVADELGVSNWMVSDAYRVLAREGLVERRARSGVFVAPVERRWVSPVSETAEWLAGVLTEASDHLIRVPILPDLVRRYTSAVQLRCACVESDLDSLTALCTESAMQFGLDSYPVAAGCLGTKAGDPLPAEIQDADLLLTTAFHAPRLRAVADALRKPLVVASLDPDDVRAIRSHVEREGGITLVCADAAFPARLRTLIGPGNEQRLRVVLAGDARGMASLDPGESLLLTRAAGQQLEGASLRLLVPRFPSFSRQSARSLAEALIRLNLGPARA